ncbi:MAG: PilZ domain-containing protein [Thermodesulfobacteriota bacterium]|nr:PilZ domain-containing protein [Thermodesulfobacteriota bacterium]
MEDSVRLSGKASLKTRLKALVKEISQFTDTASEEQKQAFWALLEDRRIVGFLENWRQGERREHPRKLCSIAVDCPTWGGAFKGLVQDISAGGVFVLSIETDREFSVGQQITVNFPAPSNRPKPVALPGEVVWSGAEGIGVRFTAERQDLQELLASL